MRRVCDLLCGADRARAFALDRAALPDGDLGSVQRFDALPLETVARGLVVGASLMIGSRLAKGFVLRLDAHQFRTLMDRLLACAGRVLLGCFR